MALEFLRIETRAGNIVAVFAEPFGPDKEFCLNEENLRTRIRNVQADGRDSSVEDAALAEIVRRSKQVGGKVINEQTS